MLALLPGTARALDPSLHVTQYRQRVWRPQDGLPQSAVDVLAVAPDGWLWVGTQEGLARFDGVRFRLVEGLDSPTIHALLATADATWIGTRGGGLHRAVKGRAEKVRAAELGSAWVTALQPDGHGGVWAGTYGAGLFHVTSSTAARVAIPDDKVLALARGPRGALWVGTSIGVFDARAGAGAAPVVEGLVFALHTDSAGALWVGLSEGGLVRVAEKNRRTWRAADGLGSDAVSAILEDRDGNLWIGTSAGLVRMRGEKLERLTAAEGLPGATIGSLAEDHEGNLWAGISGGGLVRLSNARVRPWGAPEGAGAGVVWSVLEASDGMLYAATAGDGLRVKRPGARAFEAASPELGTALHTLAEDRSGALWIGTEQGLLRRPKGASAFTAYTPTGRAIHGASTVIEDRAQRIWIGTAGAGARGFPPSGDPIKLTTAEGLPHDVVTAIVESPDGAVWLGTEGGLARWKDGALARIEGLPNPSVMALELDPEGLLWVATRRGLASVAHGAERAEKVEVCAEWINQVVSDAEGGLWLGSNRGLHHLDRRRKSPCTSFGAADGMRAVETTGGFQRSAIRARDGHLWFATTGGLVEVDPRRLPENGVAPRLEVEEVIADGVHLAPENGMVLGPGLRELEVSYTALSFSAPELVRFRHRLHGFDDQWTDAGARRAAFFTNLPPGEYVLQLEAINEHGRTNGSGLAFTVRPRFHQTWTFKLLLIAAVPALAYGAYRLRLRALEARARVLEAEVEARTRELRQAQARVVQAEKMSALGQLVAGVAHELNNPVNFITANLGALEERDRTLLDLASRVPGLTEEEAGELAYLREDGPQLIGSLKNGAGRVAAIVSELRLFTRAGEVDLREEDLAAGIHTTLRLLEPALKGVEVQLDIDPALPKVRCAASQIHQVFMNLLANAAHAMGGRGTVRVIARRDAGRVVFRFEDTGPGVPAELRGKIFEPFFTTKEVGKGTGLGLSISYAIVTAHGGTIELVPSERGAVFEVALPIEGPRA